MSISAPDNQDVSRDCTPPADSAHFEIVGSHGHLVADGSHASFTDPVRAANEIHSGTVTTIVGALAFDPEHPSALTAPRRMHTRHGALSSTASFAPVSAHVVAADPSPAEHRERVAAARAVLADPGSPLRKVVLARKLLLRSDTPLSPASVMAVLAAQNPHSGIFRTDLSSAGPAYHGKHLVGASPEVLVRKHGDVVTCHPLAGSAPRHRDPDVDARGRAMLAASTKDLGEHRFVVDALSDGLAPFCTSLDIPDSPSIFGTQTMWHLGTPITGRLADPSITALDLALAVHPTPAVCGTPTDIAHDYIRSTESDRGFYSGAIGWCVGDLGAATSNRDVEPHEMPSQLSYGDGEWLVAIRCAEIDSATGKIVTCAGGGIVADSDPDTELDETTAKLRTVLRALGVEQE